MLCTTGAQLISQNVVGWFCIHKLYLFTFTGEMKKMSSPLLVNFLLFSFLYLKCLGGSLFDKVMSISIMDKECFSKKITLQNYRVFPIYTKPSIWTTKQNNRDSRNMAIHSAIHWGRVTHARFSKQCHNQIHFCKIFFFQNFTEVRSYHFQL